MFFITVTVILLILIVIFQSKLVSNPVRFKRIEAAIAGTLGLRTLMPLSVRVPKNIVIRARDGRRYDLANENLVPIVPTGDSMAQCGLHKGDFLLFDTSVKAHDLKKGDVVALRLHQKINNTATSIKLRIYLKTEKNEHGVQRLHLRQYDTSSGLLLDCASTHPIEGYVGVKIARFDKVFCNRLVDRFKVI